MLIDFFNLNEQQDFSAIGTSLREQRLKELAELQRIDEESSYWPIVYASIGEEWEGETLIIRFLSLNAHCLWDKRTRNLWNMVSPADKARLIWDKWSHLESKALRSMEKVLWKGNFSPVCLTNIWAARPRMWRVLNDILPWHLLLLDLAKTNTESILRIHEEETLKIHYIDFFSEVILQKLQEYQLDETKVLVPIVYPLRQFDRTYYYDREFRKEGLREVMDVAREEKEAIEKFWEDMEMYKVGYPMDSPELRYIPVAEKGNGYFTGPKIGQVVSCLALMFDMLGPTVPDNELLESMLRKRLEVLIAFHEDRRNGRLQGVWINLHEDKKTKNFQRTNLDIKIV